MDGYFSTTMKVAIRIMKKILKQFFTGVLALATIFTVLPTTTVHASDTQYWTGAQRKGRIC